MNCRLIVNQGAWFMMRLIFDQKWCRNEVERADRSMVGWSTIFLPHKHYFSLKLTNNYILVPNYLYMMTMM